MGSEGSPFVDLTDDSSDGNSHSSNHSRFNYIDNPRSSTYVPSISNPAKRSRIDIPSLNPAALLNPRAYVGNGSSTARPEIQSFQGRPQLEMTGTSGSGISLNKRLEALHGLKDR